MPRIIPLWERQPSLFCVPTYGVRHAHLSRQTLASDNLWVLSFLCRLLSRETETCAVSHLPDATAVLARSASLGGIAVAREKNPCQHGKMKQHCQRPVSIFTVAVQTMACSHCRINSQSFQLQLRFFLYSNSLWEKKKKAQGWCRDQSCSYSHCVSSGLHAHVDMPSGCRNAMFPVRGVFAHSRFSFSAKRRHTCWSAPIIVSGPLPSRVADNQSRAFGPHELGMGREGKERSRERTISRCVEKVLDAFRLASRSSAFKVECKNQQEGSQIPMNDSSQQAN